MFRQLRSAVESALADALAERDLPTDDLGIEEPPADVDAVLASSVAYRLAEHAGAPPHEIAADLADALAAADPAYVGSVAADGAYVNVVPSADYYADAVAAATDATYGQLPDRDTSLVLEHTSANPTGPVHVGRARNPIVGDALARVLDAAGYDVDRHYYVNDAGRQVATLTWAVETIDESDLDAPERASPEYDLVRYYRAGTDVLSGDGEAADAAEAEIQSILEGLEAGDEATCDRVRAVVDEVLGGMRGTFERLPATFDEFVYETRFMRDGALDDVVERCKALDEAVLEEGAWQLDLPDFEKNLVFLRGDGTSLYTTRDLAHHEWKLDNYDRAVTVLGEDHKLQAEQLGTTLDLLGHDADRVEAVHYSWVNLPEGGMSTRQGTGVDLDDLLDEAVARAGEEVRSRVADHDRADLDEATIERIARQVGVGAVRFDVVATQPTKGITFEWGRALDFEAQSAPYVQYVHARCCGILAESEAAGAVASAADDPGLGQAAPDETPPVPADLADRLTEPAAVDLAETVARFPAVVERAADRRRPHVVATYARDLAEAFNAFYRECPVLDADDQIRAARLALVAAARTAVANALGLLGVAAPEQM